VKSEKEANSTKTKFEKIQAGHAPKKCLNNDLSPLRYLEDVF